MKDLVNGWGSFCGKTCDPEPIASRYSRQILRKDSGSRQMSGCQVFEGLGQGFRKPMNRIKGELHQEAAEYLFPRGLG